MNKNQYKVLESLDLDCDACALYDASSPSCQDVIAKWREVLRQHPEYVDILAELYSVFTGSPYSLVRAVLSLFARGNSDPELLDAIFVQLDGILCTSAYVLEKLLEKN